MVEGNKMANNHFLNKETFKRKDYMEEGDNTLIPVAN